MNSRKKIETNIFKLALALDAQESLEAPMPNAMKCLKSSKSMKNIVEL